MLLWRGFPTAPNSLLGTPADKGNESHAPVRFSAQVWSCTTSFPHLCRFSTPQTTPRGGLNVQGVLKPLWRPRRAVLPQERAEVLLPAQRGTEVASGATSSPHLYLAPLGSAAFPVLLLPLPACRNPVAWDGDSEIGTEGKQK